VAGLRYEADVGAAPGARLVRAEAGGEPVPVAAEREYLVAMNDFIGGGG
jgi:hypothetical protein